MRAILQKIQAALKNNVKIDQEGLELINYSLRVDKDPNKSRLIATNTLTSEIGLDLPGDTAEDMIASAFQMATGDGTLGN